MTELVLDASVVLKWFRTEGERHVRAARRLRTSFEAGALLVFAPSILPLEILNVAGRRWQWGAAALAELAELLEDLGFELVTAELSRVAAWTARGLTAFDAAYVAVAEAAAVRLVTDDELVPAVAPEVASALADEDLTT